MCVCVDRGPAMHHRATPPEEEKKKNPRLRLMSYCRGVTDFVDIRDGGAGAVGRLICLLFFFFFFFSILSVTREAAATLKEEEGGGQWWVVWRGVPLQAGKAPLLLPETLKVGQAGRS